MHCWPRFARTNISYNRQILCCNKRLQNSVCPPTETSNNCEKGRTERSNGASTSSVLSLPMVMVIISPIRSLEHLIFQILNLCPNECHNVDLWKWWVGMVILKKKIWYDAYTSHKLYNHSCMLWHYWFNSVTFPDTLSIKCTRIYCTCGYCDYCAIW